MAKEKVRLWDRLKYKYKLSVINETSYEEVFNFRLSQLHVLTALSVLAVDDRPKCAPGRFAGE